MEKVQKSTLIAYFLLNRQDKLLMLRNAIEGRC